ncbi:MAG: long-chain fatty acid--CoA ligase [Dactylosporangium sp.]|nr:long-chain fatty acid--CoA ligase [Dactylosporangium sp.]NNJ62918.1 long-chain fatty acid--CoA ligase [Dactylosporangium sp.]
MRESSVPPVATIAETVTLIDAVWANAEQAAAAPVFARLTENGWDQVSCAQFRDDVMALARGLLAAGLGPGQRVGLMSKTRYEWTLIDYAAWACGAVTVPIYETSSAEQIAWILADSGAVACFVETDRHAELVGEVRGQLPMLDHVWGIERASGEDADLGALVDGGADTPADAVERAWRSRSASDLATIIYTSGTTGNPKGCMLTHRNIGFNASNALPVLHALISEGESTLLFLPLAHSFARLIQVAAFQVRAIVAHTSDIPRLATHLQSFRPTFLLAAPRVFEKVYNTARQRSHAEGKGVIFDRAERVAIGYSRALDTDRGPGPLLRLQHRVFDKLVYSRLREAIGGRCRGAISGSAPLGVKLGHFFRGIGIPILEGYGLTETSPAVSTNLGHALRIGSVGRPLPGVSVRIAEDGEIMVRGDIVFPGYWRDEAATREAVEADGWFHTGDLGRLDDDGYLTITDRKKDIIITAAGKNVAPAMLEDRLRSHPLVSQCMVIGDRRPFISLLVTLDEEALALWKKRHDRPVDLPTTDLVDDADLRAEIQEAIAEANQSVSRAESIREFRILPEDFTEATGEITPSMKVRRAVVLQRYAREIASIYGG